MKMTLTLADLEARGVYTVVRLIERPGRDDDLVSLRLQLAADCPAYHAGQGTPWCGARFPALPGLFLT
jgi:hypothetical protein